MYLIDFQILIIKKKSIINVFKKILENLKVFNNFDFDNYETMDLKSLFNFTNNHVCAL